MDQRQSRKPAIMTLKIERFQTRVRLSGERRSEQFGTNFKLKSIAAEPRRFGAALFGLYEGVDVERENSLGEESGLIRNR